MPNTKTQAVELLLDSNRGIYIPQNFCTDFDMEAWSLSNNDKDVRTCVHGPDGEFYWEAWDNIMDKAKHHSTGHTLWQDGDLFAINYDAMTDEERKNFGFDED